jgi:hypothetical protein
MVSSFHFPHHSHVCKHFSPYVPISYPPHAFYATDITQHNGEHATTVSKYANTVRICDKIHKCVFLGSTALVQPSYSNTAQKMLETASQKCLKAMQKYITFFIHHSVQSQCLKNSCKMWVRRTVEINVVKTEELWIEQHWQDHTPVWEAAECWKMHIR